MTLPNTTLIFSPKSVRSIKWKPTSGNTFQNNFKKHFLSNLFRWGIDEASSFGKITHEKDSSPLSSGEGSLLQVCTRRNAKCIRIFVIYFWSIWRWRKHWREFVPFLFLPLSIKVIKNAVAFSILSVLKYWFFPLN